MMQEDILALSMVQLNNRFHMDYPFLIGIAQESKTKSEFCHKLRVYLRDDAPMEIEKKFSPLLANEGKTILEYSTQTPVKIRSMEHLWNFLCGRFDLLPSKTDMFVDFYFMFGETLTPTDMLFEKNTQRWDCGTDERVAECMEENKRRIIQLLINRIRSSENSTSQFHFREGMTYTEKYEQVEQWWNNHKFHLAMALKSPKDINLYLDNSLSDETMKILYAAKKKGIPFFVTPYYLSLLNVKKNGYDDRTVRSYILYSQELVDTYGNISAWEREDDIKENEPNAAGWYLPEGKNVHRRYPEVAILIPDTMGRSCGGLCASCQRMYDFQNKHLNFDLESLAPKENWPKKLERLMDYFEHDTQIRDILLTGGDALMSQNKNLKKILDAIYHMAARKQKANKQRADGQKYAEMRRVRIGSRLLAYLPMRINDELITILRDFKEKASKIGMSQFVIQTHFQSPLEVTRQAQAAIAKILSAGWIITNQHVYTVAASRRGHTARLRELLNSLGVVCYYTFSVKGFMENYHVFTPNSRSIQEQIEEKSYGKLTTQKARELTNLLADGEHIQVKLNQFMKDNELPFLATDRSVLNLPAIGKSMTFQMIGIDDQGKRILRFDHDRTRSHSPVIEHMGNINITENKSIAAYLRQIKDMGENVEEYRTIWQYTSSTTEPCFSLYKYPSYDYKVTDEISNIVEN